MEAPKLLDFSTPWLTWWQELLINYLATLPNIGTITIESPDGTNYTQWNGRLDIEMQRAILEQSLDIEGPCRDT